MKRADKMKEELQLMKILQFIEVFPSLCKPYFVDTGEKIQYQDLFNEIDILIATGRPRKFKSVFFGLY